MRGRRQVMASVVIVSSWVFGVLAVGCGEPPPEERIIGSWRSSPIYVGEQADYDTYAITTYHLDGRREVFTVIEEGDDAEPQIAGWWMDWYEVRGRDLYEYGHPNPAEYTSPRRIRFADVDSLQIQAGDGLWAAHRRVPRFTRR